MRIIHFVPYFPPDRLGGVGEFVAALHEALLARGHDSFVVTTGVTPADCVRRIAKSPAGWFARVGMCAEEAATYDIVQCQSGEALPLMLALRLRRRRPPVLATFHVSYRGMANALRPYSVDDERYGGGLRALLQRTFVAWAHRTVDALAIRLADGVNAIAKASAAELFGPASPVPVIYYGLEPLSPAIPPAAPVELLYAGATGHRKRVFLLPAILERVRREIPGARLRIAGFDLAREPALGCAFTERGLENAVECVGFLHRDQLPAHYMAARVVLVPSAYEGLPLVLLEAMQCGAAIVAANISGHPEAIADGVNGFLVPVDDPDAMADRCIALIRDDALRSRIGAAARETIAGRFGMDAHVRAYLALYEKLIAERAK